jgi:hypothetical protein
MSAEELESRILLLDERLLPIADRPIDITKPEWDLLLKQSPHPLDEAGVRAEAEHLLEELITSYQSAVEEHRQALRKLFAKYRAFAWASSLPVSPTIAEGFRQQLLLFSLKDQGRDSRDALLLLQDLCRQARTAGINTAPILNEVAELSSDINKYGMGSTKQMLLKAC